MARQLFAVLLALSAALAACSSPTVPKDPQTVSNISIVVAGTAPVVGASLPFTATAVQSDGARVDVTATAAWASSNPAILTVTAAGVVTGVAAGTASVSATFQSVTGSMPLTVTAVTCNFTVSPLSFELPKTGGTVTMNVTMTGAPCAWDAFTAHPFMHVVSGATGIGNGSIVVSIDPNQEFRRDGSVIVSHRFVALFSQQQRDCVTNVTAVPASLPAGPGYNYVTVNVAAPAGCTWRGTNPSRLVTFPHTPTGDGNGLIDLVIWVNGTGATRLNEIAVEHLKLVIPQAAPSGTYFSLTSDAADRIGGGWDLLAQSPDFPVTATAASINEARFAMSTSGPQLGNVPSPFDLTLRAPNGQPLVPGTYTNATGIAGSPALPYLNLRRPPTDCRPSGSFTVHDAVYGPGPSVVRFFATFEQRCETSPTSMLRGEISYGR